MNEVQRSNLLIKNNEKRTDSRRWHLAWHTVTFLTLSHVGAIYGIYLIITQAKWQTCAFAYMLYLMSVVGVTAGAHRMWCHRAYKAKLPLKIIFLVFFTISFERFFYKALIISMNEVQRSNLLIKNNEKRTDSRRWHLAWHTVTFLTLSHVGAIYGIYLIITQAKWQTCAFAYMLYLMSVVGVTAGAHRMWCHRAYKAKLPLKIIFLVFFTISFEVPIYQWVIYHRIHHMYCDMDADPHNASRGFFFSHIGWTLLKEHPEVTAKAKDVDVSDIKADKVIGFQKKYYPALVLLTCYIIPTCVPTLWGEEKWTAFFIAAVLRHAFALHAIFSINSVAHRWGSKPYDKNILPVETKLISILASGEGFHNYHHTFPWDYKAAELGGYTFNWSTLFIDLMAKIGWAYDLRTVSEEMIEKRVMRTGDGTHPVFQ